MKAMIVPVTAFGQNCSILWCEETMEGAVVDPGGDLAEVEAAAKRKGVTIVKILLTHGHVDHAAGTAALKASLKVQVEGRIGRRFLLEQLPDSCAGLAFLVRKLHLRPLMKEANVTFGKVTTRFLHCPGLPGPCVFFDARRRWRSLASSCFRVGRARTTFRAASPRI
jgi:glyoxylase-like metal-dependent hydrolase (beta-lactamase superfamily II)